MRWRLIWAFGVRFTPMFVDSLLQASALTRFHESSDFRFFVVMKKTNAIELRAFIVRSIADCDNMAASTFLSGSVALAPAAHRRRILPFSTSACRATRTIACASAGQKDTG